MKVYAVGSESEVGDLYINEEHAISSFINDATSDEVSQMEITKALADFEKCGYGFADMGYKDCKIGWTIAEYNVIE